MAETNQASESDQDKGKAFFDRADEVAETGNWDFAIEMYLEGIAREPENIERGHHPLRNVAMNRKAQGGKGPSFKDGRKRRPGKDPLENLVNAEYLLGKEPGSVQYMEQVLKAAQALTLNNVVKWICDIMLEAQRLASRPNAKVLLLLTQSYHDIEDYATAIQACQMALQQAPNSHELNDAIKELTTKYTIQKGRYGEEGDFAKGVKDMDKQKELMEKDRMVQSKSYQEQVIDRTREEYLADPTVSGKINAFVDALLKPEEETYENEAVDVLTKAHKDTGAYQVKMRIGEIKIRQMTRRFRKLQADGDKKGAVEHMQKQLAFELTEYAERAENYPTDLAIKYELGRRQFLAGRYDDAIASLQQAQRDPRRHVLAMNCLGQAFAKKQWYREAADTFRRALESEMPEMREKELRYSLGDVLEKTDQLAEALSEFSKVAQLDFNFRDVRDRVEALRKKIGSADNG